MTREKTPGYLRILIYLFPALIDTVAAQFLFINTVRVAKMGATDSIVAGITTVWSISYLVTCLTVGRLVTPLNSAKLMLASCISMAILAGLCTVVPGIVAIYVLTALAGAAAALFFPPFQTFMKAVDQGGRKTIPYSTGLYTFSWSTGFAAGPFVSGFLMELGSAETPGGETYGWRLAYAFGAVAALITAGGILYLKHLVQPDKDAEAPAAETAQSIDYSRMPDLAWLAWIGAGVGIIVISIIRAVFPAHAVKILDMSDSTLGMLFFLLSITQAFVGLMLCRSRVWMYRALPVSIVGFLGVLGTACFAFGSSNMMLGVGAVLFGIYSGSFFFYLVFHAIAHPVKSAFYVAINESVVGIGGIIGPLIGGLLSDKFGFALSACVGVGTILAVTVFQAVVHRRRPAAEAA